MKKVLLLFTLLVSISCFAQQRVWETLRLDSTSFIEVYGSVKEYEVQKEMANGSSHGHKVFFTGFSPVWLKSLTDYAVNELGYSPTVLMDDGADWISFEAAEKIYQGKSIPFVAKAQLDAKGKIKSVMIKGKAEDMIRLFIYFWDTSEVKLAELKKNGSVYQTFMYDKIAFSWKGETPTISITPNPLVGRPKF